jgi:hypothetical protein
MEDEEGCVGADGVFPALRRERVLLWTVDKGRKEGEYVLEECRWGKDFHGCL